MVQEGGISYLEGGFNKDGPTPEYIRQILLRFYDGVDLDGLHFVSPEIAAAFFEEEIACNRDGDIYQTVSAIVEPLEGMVFAEPFVLGLERLIDTEQSIVGIALKSMFERLNSNITELSLAELNLLKFLISPQRARLCDPLHYEVISIIMNNAVLAKGLDKVWRQGEGLAIKKLIHGSALSQISYIGHEEIYAIAKSTVGNTRVDRRGRSIKYIELDTLFETAALLERITTMHNLDTTEPLFVGTSGRISFVISLGKSVEGKRVFTIKPIDDHKYLLVMADGRSHRVSTVVIPLGETDLSKNYQEIEYIESDTVT